VVGVIIAENLASLSLDEMRASMLAVDHDNKNTLTKLANLLQQPITYEQPIK
jgi:hypothetical protein